MRSGLPSSTSPESRGSTSVSSASAPASKGSGVVSSVEGASVDRLDRAPGQQVGGQLGVGGQALAQRLLDPVEVVQQDGGVGRALVAVAGGRARHQGVDVVGDAGLDQRRHRHVVVDVAVGHLDR